MIINKKFYGLDRLKKEPKKNKKNLKDCKTSNKPNLKRGFMLLFERKYRPAQKRFSLYLEVKTREI